MPFSLLNTIGVQMLRTNLSLVLVCVCAISAHASISTNFTGASDGDASFTAVSGINPGFQATFGAGPLGTFAGSPGALFAPGFTDSSQFYNSTSNRAFGLQLAAPGSAFAFVSFDSILASSVSFTGFVSQGMPGETFETAQTGAATLGVLAYDNLGNPIAGSAGGLSVDGSGVSTYNFASASGIRTLRLQLNGAAGANPFATTLTSFSATATPEPSSMALLGLAGLSGAAVRRYRRRRPARVA
ncbi:PEP-CTERM sorting domain-containing protein [Rosistilla oblonga]|uniref:PEP-CTERM sorting domain-containing protein n=1 Tax=Rosistilla oblonga TaxID=2527990 RepID=UPI0011A697F2|nr:PEP-CTERM sorting domain-containing protein [Rosistilla oblonga]